MSPVGGNDSRNFVDIVGNQGEKDQHSKQSILWASWIQIWFICLVSALQYMHQHGIHHQDIKPSKIIHKREQDTYMFH
jgi:serine/threonine protein kinase